MTVKLYTVNLSPTDGEGSSREFKGEVDVPETKVLQRHFGARGLGYRAEGL